MGIYKDETRADKKTKVVGHRVDRVDGVDKVCGKTKYGVDYSLAGMHVGKILRSPYPHARIKRIDISKAKALEGVKAVVTAEDVPQNKYGTIKEDEYLFAREKVRYQGEEVLGVVAVDEDTANRALELIEVEYEELEHVTHPLEAKEENAPVIHEEHPNNIALSYTIERGDYEKAFQDAYKVVSKRFEIPMSHQSHLEPLAVAAEYDGSKLNLYSAAQEPFFTRRETAYCLDMEETDVVLHVLMAGGGFGARCDQKLPIVVGALAYKAGVAVKLINTREEEMTSGRPLMPVVVELQLALSEQGYFLAKKTKITAENGAYTSVAPPMLNVASTRSDSLYRYPALYTESELVYTNKPASSAYRGFGNKQIHFPMESLIDDAAHALGINPIDIRIQNATREGDITIHGWEINSCGYVDCLNLLKEKYTALKEEKEYSTSNESPSAKAAEGTKVNPEKKDIKKGLGVAGFIHVSGNRTTMPEFGGSSAMLKINHDGKVQLYSGETCVGQGVHTVFAQIISEELGLETKDIEIVLGNTDETPYALGCHASRVTTLGGNAVLRAAREAAGKIKVEVADIFNTSEDNIELSDGFVMDNITGEKMSFQESARRVVLEKWSGLPLLAIGVYEPDIEMPDFETKYGNLSAAYPFGAHLIEVGVDVKTGKVEVEKVFACHDSGRAINPLMVEGQIEGGIVMGIGFTLMEEMIYVDGVLKNDNFVDYKIPTIMDAPEIDITLVETIDPEGPYGAKGVGETPLIPVAPAIANAVFDAVGKRVTSLPITPQKLFTILEEE